MIKEKKSTACVRCGTCTTVCPIYQVTGRESDSARGKHFIITRLPEKERTAAYDDVLSKCLLCGACREVCPRNLDTPRLVIAARHEASRLTATSLLTSLARHSLTRPAFFVGLRKAGAAADRLFFHILPPESGLRLRLAACRPEISPPASGGYLASLTPVPSGQQTSCSYFAGCLANHLRPEIGKATDRLLRRIAGAPPAVPAAQTCCGMAALAAGDVKQAKKLARKNIEAFASDSQPILTSCASCYSHLLSYPELFADEPDWHERALLFAERLREFSCFFQGMIGSRAVDYFIKNYKEANVLYHDPCHLRFRLHILAEPRWLLAQLPGVVIRELPDGPRCCGQGGLFHIIHPEISSRIRNRLLADFAGLTVDTVVSTCSGCLLQWQQAVQSSGSSCRVEHLAVLMEERLLPDPEEKTL